jgi:hypothetical protein
MPGENLINDNGIRLVELPFATNIFNVLGKNLKVVDELCKCLIPLLCQGS